MLYVNFQYDYIVLINIQPLFESCLFKVMTNWIKAQLKDP